MHIQINKHYSIDIILEPIENLTLIDIIDCMNEYLRHSKKYIPITKKDKIYHLREQIRNYLFTNSSNNIKWDKDFQEVYSCLKYQFNKITNTKPQHDCCIRNYCECNSQYHCQCNKYVKDYGWNCTDIKIPL